jgi:SMC interacting uncharacterized protein involved in chromosome segregation
VYIVSSEKIDMNFDKLWGELKTQRDELRVQVHLAEAEIKEEWEEVEDKYQYAQDKFDELTKRTVEATVEATDDARVRLDVVLEEIGEAYSRVKHRLKKS